MADPIVFRTADERQAWDGYVSAVAARLFPANSQNLQNLEHAAQVADELLAMRRLRDTDAVVNEATDGTDAEGWNVARNLPEEDDAGQAAFTARLATLAMSAAEVQS